MNHIQFQVSAGTIAVTWNSQGRLQRLDWFYSGVAPLEAMSREQALQWAALANTPFPPRVADLLERLRLFFLSGEPLGDLPWDAIETRGWTDFQREAYRCLSGIPHGETRTYAWLARKVGQPGASRAIGQALRKNPLPILIPCHRVVSAKNVGGFMGVEDPNQPEPRFKKWLIDLEGLYINPIFPFLGSSMPNLSCVGDRASSSLLEPFGRAGSGGPRLDAPQMFA